MDEVKTADQKQEEYIQKVKAAIMITRSMIHKGRMAPKGYIFYPVKFKTFMDEKYEGVRMIDLEQEKALGQDKIVDNIKMEIAAKHYQVNQNDFITG